MLYLISIFSTDANRKHQRDEDDRGKGNEEESEEGIKAMRYGSLGRIIANSVVATSVTETSQKLPERTPAQREEFRKDLIVKFFKSLNFSNMKELARLIREQFHEACLTISPDISEPICGRKDITILFSMMLERYPDSVWSAHNIATTQLDTMTCTYGFQGTSVFIYPMDNLFRQIRSHISKLSTSSTNIEQFGGYSSSRSTSRNNTAPNSRNNSYSNSSIHPADILDEINSMQIVNEVSEYCHSTPSLNTSLPMVPSPLSKKLSSSAMTTSWDILDPLHHHHATTLANNTIANTHADNHIINIPRRDQSLRDVKFLDAALLKENNKKYRRKADFVFNEYDQVVRLIMTDIH